MTRPAHWTCLIAASLSVPVVSAGLATQRGLTGVLLVNVEHYSGVTYAAHPLPNSTYVFYPDEPIELRIVVANRGSDPIRLSTTAATVAENFSARRLDGGPITLAFEPEVRVRRVGEPARIIAWGPDVHLESREAVVFRASVAGPALPPGEYAIEITSVMREGDGRTLAPQASRIYFELRGSSAETQIEEIARRAARAIFIQDYDTAEVHIAALTKLHPQGFAAHAFRGRIQEARGNKQAAVAAYTQALRVLETDTDQLYNRTSTPELRRQRAQEFRTLVNAR